MQPWASHGFRLPVAALLANATGKTRWGRGCDWDEGAQHCAPRKCKVYLHGTLALGDRVCCKLGSRLILQPLLCMDKPSLAVWLFVLAAVPASNRRRHLSPAAAALTRASSNSSSPGGTCWRGLSLAFALHSSTSRPVTRALKKRLLQPEWLGQKQTAHEPLGKCITSPNCSGRSALSELTWDLY